MTDQDGQLRDLDVPYPDENTDAWRQILTGTDPGRDGFEQRTLALKGRAEPLDVVVVRAEDRLAPAG